MAKSELIGLCNCPECGFKDAEVRNDKSGAPYRFCPDCTSQYFTRGEPHKAKNLLAKLHQAKAAPAEAIAPAPAPVAKALTIPAIVKPARKTFDMADL